MSDIINELENGALLEKTITVEYGLSDWEIKPQVNGFAEDFEIGGYYEEFCPEGYGETVACIMVRVIEEDTGNAVTDWQVCELLSGHRWKTVIRHLPAGGLYQLETLNRFLPDMWIENGIRGQIVSHFGVGDVYFIAGQSNASGTGLGLGYDAPELGVHLLRDNKRWELAVHPLQDRHSPFLAFAKRMKKYCGYPIGLCMFAVGGVKIDTYLPEQDGILYRRMLETSGKFGLKPKALLWYQGCSDAFYETDYEADFKLFVSHVREDFGEDLPIFTFQLNSHRDDQPSEAEQQYHDRRWDEIRDVQRRMPYELKKIWCIPTIDAQMSDGIHNRRSANVMLGERLANYVLRGLFGYDYLPYCPEIDRITLSEGDKLDLIFKNVSTMIMVFHVHPEHLPVTVRDDEGIIGIAALREDKNILHLTLARKAVGSVFVSGQTGTRTRQYIQDLGTSQPISCFLDVEAERI